MKQWQIDLKSELDSMSIEEKGLFVAFYDEELSFELLNTYYIILEEQEKFTLNPILMVKK